MKTRVILISGKMGSGKDTLAHNFNDKADEAKGVVCHKLKFADPLYALHDALYAKAVQIGMFTEPNPKDGRLLQLLGTEWGRETIGENVWVDAFKTVLEKTKNIYSKMPHVKTLYVFVTDCRFENEFDALEGPGVMKLRLEADESVRKERAESWREDTTHPSETGLDAYAKEGKFDYYLDTAVLNEEQSLSFMEKAIEGHFQNS